MLDRIKPRAAFVLTTLMMCVSMATPSSAQSPEEQPPTDEPAASESSLSDDDPSAITVYRDDLAPYGRWVDDPRWGTVWIPSVVVVGRHFTPYRSRGHWAMSEDGDWIWVSDYPWGYAVFHYGRWVWMPELGVWAWVPGRSYAPAWVVWRVGEPDWDYVGWAPMPPSWCWYGGVAVTCVHDPVWAFWFVPSVYLFHPHWHLYVLHPARAHMVAAHTHVHARHGRPPRHRRADATAHQRAPSERGEVPRAEPRALRPTSPTLAEAHIPKSAIPASRKGVHHDPRALQLEKRPSRAPLRGLPSKATPPRRTKPPTKATPPRRTKPPTKATPPRRTKPPKARPPRKSKPRPKVKPRPKTKSRKTIPPRRTKAPRRSAPRTRARPPRR